MLNTDPISLILKNGSINYQVKFPNTGEFIRIENLKNRLANNAYDMYFRNDVSGMLAKLNIDTIATVSILCPDIFKDLQKESLQELDLEEMAELCNWYMNTYSPWYNDILVKLSNIAWAKPKENEDAKK